MGLFDRSSGVGSLRGSRLDYDHVHSCRLSTDTAADAAVHPWLSSVVDGHLVRRLRAMSCMHCSSPRSFCYPGEPGRIVFLYVRA